MARVFDVTVGSQNVQHNSRGEAEVAFTVTNVSGRPIRGRARAVAPDDKNAGWLTISGNSERDFPPGGTEQFNVKVSVPATIPPGAYNFRIDVISMANPDEDYTQGPAVAIQVTRVVDGGGNGFPWWILIVLGILVLGLVLWLVLRKKEPPPPPPPPPVKACRQPGSTTAAPVTPVNAANFGSQIGQATRPQVVLFWAQWAGPARAMLPQLDQAAKDFSTCAGFAKFDVDESSVLANKLNIRGVPSVIVFSHGQPVDPPARPADASLKGLEDLIDAALAKAGVTPPK